MTFYILANHIATLFISLGVLTTLTFDSEVTNYLYGGSKSDLFIQLTNNSKTIAVRPKRENVSSNLLVITRNRKYYFNIRYNDDSPHNFVEVKSGQKNSGLKSIVKTSRYEILEGRSSLLFINKSKNRAKVNEFSVRSREYLSKGIPLFLNQQRILY